MGVRAYKDPQGRTRYRVTFSRNGRRLADERLPAGTSKEKAERYYGKLSGDWFDRNRLGVQEIPLISTVIREYEKRVKPSLRSKYANSNIRCVAPFVVGKTLDKLPDAAEAIRDALRDRAPATIACRLIFLKTLAKRAVKWKLADRDYGVTIEPPSFNNKRQYYVTKAELAEILKHADKAVRRASWQLFYSGMRRGELYDCKITRDSYVLQTSKNTDPRVVPIPDAVRRIVGRPTIHRDVLSARFKEAAIKAGYGHLRLHDLRHSTASSLLRAGAPLSVIGPILGHRSERSAKRYSHLATDTARTWLNFAARGLQVYDKQDSQSGAPRTKPKKAA